jgi:hypothetical protein
MADALHMNRRSFLYGASCALVQVVTDTARAQAEPLCVIVGARTGQSGLQLHELRRIFLAQPTDGVGGVRFVPFNAPPHSFERASFDRVVLGMDPDAIARYWVDQRIRGTQAPRTLSSPDMLLRVVAKLPGAIGYVSANRVTPDARVLRIDGRLPGESGYPLRS